MGPGRGITVGEPSFARGPKDTVEKSENVNVPPVIQSLTFRRSDKTISVIV